MLAGRFANPAGVVQAALLLGLCGGVDGFSKSSSSGLYELTVNASAEACRAKPLGSASSHGRQAGRVFLPVTNDQRGHRLNLRGTVGEKSPEHFYLERFSLEFSSPGGSAGSVSADRVCDSEETMKRSIQQLFRVRAGTGSCSGA